MPRTIVDLRPPQLDLHGIAGREFALDIPVTGGVLTSPVLTMKTAAGDAYTTDPGVGTATMPSADTLRVAWTAADMSALNTTTRAKTYRIEVAGSIDGAAVASVIGGLLTTYPTTWTRSVPTSSASLVLNNGTTLALEVSVPAPDGPIDGGRSDEVYGGDLPGIDGGSYSSTYTDTTYDGGTP